MLKIEMNVDLNLRIVINYSSIKIISILSFELTTQIFVNKYCDYRKKAIKK